MIRDVQADRGEPQIVITDMDNNRQIILLFINEVIIIDRPMVIKL